MPNVATLAFDDQGRLWAGTAAFTDDGTDGVYVIAQPGATPQLVISGQHTVLGLLWYKSELYVSSKESVDAYSNFDGSRFVKTRRVLSLPSGVGEVNGLAVSPEGRLILGVSAPCNACVSQSQYSAAVLSFLPDGSDLQVDDANIRAPIDFAYYPGTSDLFVTMNQRDDLGDATPGDWLAVIKPGEDWRFPDCYGQGGSVCQDVPGPVAVLDPHAAVSGLAIVPGASGSNAYAVVAEWAKAKLLKVDLTKSGSGYSGQGLDLRHGPAGAGAGDPVLGRQALRRRLEDRHRLRARERLTPQSHAQRDGEHDMSSPCGSLTPRLRFVSQGELRIV